MGNVAESVEIAPRQASGLTLEPVEAAIVAAIRRDGPQSRTDLAERLDTSRASITPIVGRLLAGGILAEVGEGKSAGGRRPYLLDVNPGFGYVAGVDIGATSVDVALADFRGAILERAAEPADVRARPDEFLGRVAELLADLLARRDANATEVLAIGVGVPGPVEFTPGVLIAPPLMPLWEGFPIKSFLRRRFPAAQVVVDNDVNVGTLGEFVYGAGKGRKSMVGIFVGTGVGGALILNGQLVRGARYSAGEVGHTVILPDGPLCGCGKRGCLEALASRTAIERDVRAALDAGRPSILAQLILADNNRLTSGTIKLALEQGDDLMTEVVSRAQYYLGLLAGNLVNILDPEMIVFGGGVIEALGESFLDPIRATARPCFLSQRDVDSVSIVPATLGDYAGVLGAAELAGRASRPEGKQDNG